MKQKSSVCRPATNECDLVELCSGDSSECPVNTHKKDGTSCTVNGVCIELCTLPLFSKLNEVRLQNFIKLCCGV